MASDLKISEVLKSRLHASNDAQPESSRIRIRRRRGLKVSSRIAQAELVKNGRISEEVGKRLVVSAIANVHDGAVAPIDMRVIVARECLGIGGHEHV